MIDVGSAAVHSTNIDSNQLVGPLNFQKEANNDGFDDLNYRKNEFKTGSIPSMHLPNHHELML